MGENDGSRDRLVQILLAMLLVISLVGINVVSVADRTLLQSDETKVAFEEADTYEQLTEELRADLVQNLSGPTLNEEQAVQMVQPSLTEEFVRAEVDRNIEDTHVFLNGDRADVEIRLEMQPVRDNLHDQADDPAVRQEINGTVPEAVIIEDEVAASPLGTANLVTSQIPLILSITTIIAVIALGALGYVLNSYSAIATKVGVSIGIAGFLSVLISAIVLFILRSVTLSAEGYGEFDTTIVFDGVTRAIENAIYTMAGQSVVLLVVGIALVGVGFANDSQLASGTTSETEPSKSTENNDK